MDTSIVIRTFNEARYLDELLEMANDQDMRGRNHEVVLVDSGSTDATLDIAQKHGCRIVHINKEEFTFGRSLNLGCAAAEGEHLVFISGHCVPCDRDWLWNLTQPLREGRLSYSYGSQVGRDTTKFSEEQVFRQTYGSGAKPHPYFVNNANAALLRSAWLEFPFDEDLSGLEDMHLGKRLVSKGHHVGFAEDAAVYHIHDETWSQVRWRYEREALALQEIDHSLHMSRRDLIRCIVRAVRMDSRRAREEGCLRKELLDIIRFRTCQYWGSYTGSHASRRLSADTRRRYFYPTT